MKFRQGSERFGTSVMKDDEVPLFIEAAMENGSDIAEAISDMKMLDTLLHMRELHKVVHVHVSKTGRGYSRKSAGFYQSIESIIEARVKGAFDLQLTEQDQNDD